METFREIIGDVAESNWGKSGNYLVDIGLFIIDTAQNRRVIRTQKLNIFRNKNYDMSYLYNEVILKNFVARNFNYYGNNKEISIRKVKAEIESKRYFQRNIILTGQAGTGKSTALKWLFLNSYTRKCNYIFLYAKMFNERESLDEVLVEIESIIPDDKSSIIFFDGLDELKCVKGNAYEFNKFINFFDKKSNPNFSKLNCKFVISTRPEHFGFNKMILNKNIERSLDNYLIIELSELTKNEALKICKTIKKLYQFDKKNGVFNFTNKWPSKELKNKLFDERKYIKILKKYLDTTTAANSLLDIPLLCRYAYQIICDWYVSDQDSNDQNFNTQSDKVKKVIECCIKWEFHDRYTYQTEGGMGKDYLEKYKDRIYDFLTDLAGIMEKNKIIDKDQWESLKKAKKVQEINEAFCVLQEVKDKGEKEKICFVHNTFYNYFLARYYALMEREERNKNNGQFIYILKSNSEFAVMYMEQLLIGTDKLAKKICSYILQQENTNTDKLIEYARGNLRYICTSNIPFTIEEYLSIFPNGICECGGIVFNKQIFDTLCFDGILKAENINFLKIFDKNVISNSEYIKGIQINRLDASVNYINSCFIVHLEGENAIIDYEQKSMDEDERFKMLNKINFDEISNPDNDRIEIIKKQINKIESEKLSYDITKICKLLTEVIKIIESYKNYWCILDGTLSLYIYQMIPENEEKMISLFNNGRKISKREYVAAYGKYKTSFINTNKLIDEGSFQKICEIAFAFDCNCKLQGRFEWTKCLHFYSVVHSMNGQILSLCLENYKGDVYKELVAIVFSIYRDVEIWLENLPNEKLKLYFSDEKLLSFYAIGEGEKMVKLAEDTIGLCIKYNHLMGIKFRKFLLDDNTCFNGKDLKEVYSFATNYIWI